jgi:hypothetical protein
MVILDTCIAIGPRQPTREVHQGSRQGDWHDANPRELRYGDRCYVRGIENMIRKESTRVNLAFNAQQYFTELTVGIDPLTLGEQYLNRRISSDLSCQTKTSKYLP